ncbi:MAG TPA: PQQ-dependent sugar dehydrogenase [Polyangiaceae bacterium]|nr:PQQ-dependent sugar dehydrogenase [Polyangiaceae bacterium]
MVDSRSASVRRSVVLGALSALGLVLAASPASAKVTLAAAAAADLDAKVVFEGLAEPTDSAELPDGRVVVTNRTGDLDIYTMGTPDPAVAHIDVDASHNERGLLGVVADPDFATNNYIYVYASQGNDDKNRQKIIRYKLSADGKLSDEKYVVKDGLWGPANHNGGGISIYGGNMYIGVGDTGHNADTPHNLFGSCLNHANGKLLRVSLAEATLGQPPADNPLVGVAMATGCNNQEDPNFIMAAPDPRIFAWGFRNPFRVWVDPQTGKPWVGDVGETSREEITVVDVAKGRHYGYPFWEGNKEYNQAFKPADGCMGLTPKSACVPPQVDYPHGGALAVMGGRILDGCGWPDAWKKRYIYADHETGKVWTADVTAARDGLVANSVADFGSAGHPTSMRMGTDNALYITDRGDGSVTRITAKAAPPAMPGSCLTTNPAPTGGNAGGTGGTSATGGTNPGAGTNAGGTGVDPVGGTNPGTGGTSSTSGGSSTTAGTTSTNPGAGTNASGGTVTGASGSSGGGNSGDSGGCGCAVVGGRGSAAIGLFGALAALGILSSRRRSRR